MVYIYWNAEWKKNKFYILKVIKSWVASKYTAKQTEAAKIKRSYKKKHHKPYMAKKTIKKN